MSATITASGALTGLPMRVRNKTLLAILALIPIFAITAIIDIFWLDGALNSWMLNDPAEIAMWAAVLTLPHIIASLVTFADREYIKTYARRLRYGILISISLAFFSQAIFGFVGILLVMAFYTMYHNLMQQYGISLMMCRQPPTLDYHLWRWFTIVPAGVAYTALMASDEHVIITHWDQIVYTIGTFLAFASIFGYRLVRTVMRNPNHTKIGLIYLLSNMAMLYVCFGLIATGYGFMATLLPRLTHDLTAFLVYIVHDQNRNTRGKIHNPIYYLPIKLGISPAIACIPIALGISYVLLDLSNNIGWVLLLVTSCNFMHYYMETYMWHRGTPHRQYVPFD